MSQFERRNFKGGCEIRSAASGKPVIAGYGVVFNSRSQSIGGQGGFVETVDPKALTRTLREDDIRALANHDPNQILGRTSNGTLRIGVDTRGAEYEIDVNMKDPIGQSALARVERGDWDGSSFGFRAEQDEWNLNANPRERRLLDLTMRDIGPVTFPAYLETSSHATGAMRSLANELGCEVRDVEQAFQTDVLGSLFEHDKPGEKRERIEINMIGGRSGRSNTQTQNRDTTADATNNTIVWAPEEGFQDLCSDINALLNADAADDGPRYWCCDVATSLDRALIANWNENKSWVVPISIGEDGEPVVGDESTWTEVEQAWVASSDAARALLATFENRAGKMLSKSTVGRITEAMTMLQQLLADASGTDGTDTVPGPKTPGDLNDDGDIDPPLERALTDAEVEARLNALRLRRYSPANIAA